MIRRRLRAAHGSERGASLLLTIGFVLMVGAISAGLLSFITTSVGHRAPLDAVRDKQYAADGAVEYAIAQVRASADPGVTVVDCTAPRTINGVTIRVECTNARSLVVNAGFVLEQRNVVFTACTGTSPCTPATTVLRAQVNFEKAGTGPVTATYVQSWSVNQ